MTDEMEPTLRLNTANATMTKAVFAINTANKSVRGIMPGPFGW